MSQKQKSVVTEQENNISHLLSTMESGGKYSPIIYGTKCGKSFNQNLTSVLISYGVMDVDCKDCLEIINAKE